MRHLLLIVGLTARCATAAEPPADRPSAADVEFFERQVRPLLVERCQGCHSA